MYMTYDENYYAKLVEDEDAEAYQTERENNRLEEHFAPAEGNVY